MKAFIQRFYIRTFNHSNEQYSHVELLPRIRLFYHKEKELWDKWTENSLSIGWFIWSIDIYYKCKPDTL